MASAWLSWQGGLLAFTDLFENKFGETKTLLHEYFNNSNNIFEIFAEQS